jgi:hypothetical protein
MRGYISKHWNTLHHTSKLESKNKKQCPWELKITQLISDMHRGIWEDLNKHVHGKTVEESREGARQAINKRVREIDDNPPQLAKCYKQITKIHFEICIRQSPTKLKDWLTCIKHQKQMTALLDVIAQPRQLTIHQAFENMKKISGEQPISP